MRSCVWEAVAEVCVVPNFISAFASGIPARMPGDMKRTSGTRVSGGSGALNMSDASAPKRFSAFDAFPVSGFCHRT